jgi:hypothetical protein
VTKPPGSQPQHGRIAVLQELLGIDQFTADELNSFDKGRVTVLAEQLQARFLNRSPDN